MKKVSANDPSAVGSASAGASDPDSPTPSLTAPFIPDHELLKKIGSGSYGEVWLARSVMGTFRAVKVVRRESFEHDKPYEREFAGIQKFEPISRAHEGHVDILHVGRNEAAGYFYYVMELADAANDECRMTNVELPAQPAGATAHSSFVIRHSEAYTPRTLKSEIKHRGPLPVDECVAIGLALTRALVHLHGHGLVHRDIKPSNIIFVDGAPKLADIGLVTGIDATRSFVGTDGYIPPEGPGTPQADLYSLGKVFYEMSTGQDRQDFPELPAAWRRSAERERLLEFNEVVLKACESDVHLRYLSAQQLESDLALLQRGQSVKGRRAAQRRLALGIRAGLTAAAVTALLYTLRSVKFEWLGVNPPQPGAFAFHPSTPRSTPATEEAAKLYQKGRFHFDKLSKEDLQKAIEYLKQAIQIDHNFAPAYATLFEIFVWDLDFSPDRTAKVKEVANRLMEIDDTLPEARNAWAFVKFLNGDWLGAETEVKQAIALDPKCAIAHSYYGFYLVLQGRLEEGRTHMLLAVELQPTSRIFTTVSGYPFYAARDYDRAISQFRKALDLDANFFFARWWMGRTYEAKGDCLAAIREFEKNAVLAGETPDRVKSKYDALRDAFARGSEQGYWRKRLETGWYEPLGIIGPKSPYYLAEIQARLGDKERALELLEEADQLCWLKFDPYWDSLREEPRFRTLLRKTGLESNP